MWLWPKQHFTNKSCEQLSTEFRGLSIYYGLLDSNFDIKSCHMQDSNFMTQKSQNDYVQFHSLKFWYFK